MLALTRLAGRKLAFGSRRSLAAEARVAEAKTLAEQAHLNSGTYIGAACLGGALLVAEFVPEQTLAGFIVQTVDFYRDVLGVPAERVNDAALVVDNFQQAMDGAACLLGASPLFYGMFHLIHRVPVHLCLLRAATGTLQIVPVMATFFALLGLGTPLAANAIMVRTGEAYGTAKFKGQAAILFGGLILGEVAIELKGCGVPMRAIRLFALAAFLPALIGRLATGVALQVTKNTDEFANVLPAGFKKPDAPAWQREPFHILLSRRGSERSPLPLWNSVSR